MSKTFKCVEHEEEVLEVYPFTDDEAGRKFSLLMPHVSSNAGIAFDSTTAPALALAILEAAGVEDRRHWNQDVEDGTDVHLEYIAKHLADYIKAQERIATEAEAQAGLEAEALELRNAFSMANGGAPIDSFAGHSVNKPGWSDAARRAREINKETPND